MAEYANKTAGRMKRVFGRLTRNRSMQAEGTVQEYRGRAQGARRNARQVGREVRSGARRAVGRARAGRPVGRGAGSRRVARPARSPVRRSRSIRRRM